MTKKYTRGDLEEIAEVAVEEVLDAWDPDIPASDAVARRVIDFLSREGIFDPNQVEGA